MSRWTLRLPGKLKLGTEIRLVEKNEIVCKLYRSTERKDEIGCRWENAKSGTNKR